MLAGVGFFDFDAFGLWSAPGSAAPPHPATSTSVAVADSAEETFTPGGPAHRGRESEAVGGLREREGRLHLHEAVDALAA